MLVTILAALPSEDSLWHAARPQPALPGAATFNAYMTGLVRKAFDDKRLVR